MKSRAAQLSESQAPRESRRIDSTVIRVLYASFALSILFTISGIPPRQLDPTTVGLAYIRAMTVVHAAMAVLLAIRLAGDIAGDRAAGFVGLLYLTGISASEAVMSRLQLATISFLSVWIVRVPILVLAFHLGGTTLQQILQVEASCWGCS